MHKSLMKIVVFRMRDDKITAVVKSDHLILQYGSMLLRKLGEKQVLDISTTMCELIARISIGVHSYPIYSLSLTISCESRSVPLNTQRQK